MKDPPAIIRDSDTLFRHYHQLSKSTIICTRIRMKAGEEQLLTDLTERGVRLIPSATSQLASRSKVFQTRLFGDFMLPGTSAIYDNHTLLNSISRYQKQQFGKVVLKRERKNGGIGIHLFANIEEIYNHVTAGGFKFPFVIQPFQPNTKDLRVIILSDYQEAYQRSNDYNFRNNLHCGGRSEPIDLTEDQILLCNRVMVRGRFPYAHIDLMQTPDGKNWLTEINLRGGLRGAQITDQNYRQQIDNIHEQLLSQCGPEHKNQFNTHEDVFTTKDES